MDLREVLTAFDRERRELDVSGFQRLASPQLVWHRPADLAAAHDTAGLAGFVSYSHHSPAEIDAVVGRVISGFGEAGCEFEWKVFEHDLPADLVARLAQRGFRIGEPEDLLVLSVAEAATVLGARSPHRVERVTAPEGVRDYLTVAGAKWHEEPGYVDWVQREMRDHPDQIALYVAYVGDVPAASARASFPLRSRFAGLWAGVTLPAYRRQGLYTALVAARAREAAARGFEYLMVDAGPMSRPMLARLGFRRVSASRPCRWPPATEREQP